MKNNFYTHILKKIKNLILYNKNYNNIEWINMDWNNNLDNLSNTIKKVLQKIMKNLFYKICVENRKLIFSYLKMNNLNINKFYKNNF